MTLIKTNRGYSYRTECGRFATEKAEGRGHFVYDFKGANRFLGYAKNVADIKKMINAALQGKPSLWPATLQMTRRSPSSS